MDISGHGSHVAGGRKIMTSNPFFSKTVFVFMCGAISGALFVSIIKTDSMAGKLSPVLLSDSGIDVPMIQFPEPAWRTESTLAVRTVASTPFARFEIHKVSIAVTVDGKC